MLTGKGMTEINKTIISGGVIITLLIIVAIIAPLISPSEPLAQNLSASLSSPGGSAFFGTDSLGRDIFSRVVYGSRISLTVGITVLTLTLFLGTFLGMLAGYFGGVLDSVLMRVSDVFMSFPPLVLAMIVMAFIGPGIANLVGVLVIIRWPQFARLVRGQVISVKGMAYVDAARIAGTHPLKIVLKHILPNCFAPVITYGTMSVGAIIIDETALSFLGLGIQPPAPSWGVMLADAKNYIAAAPWLVIFPGLAMIVTVLGFNLLGDGLGYLLNPKQRERIEVTHGNIKG
ncbi:MAG: ABC transporter permease [Eubacteriales bacterium]